MLPPHVSAGLRDSRRLLAESTTIYGRRCAALGAARTASLPQGIPLGNFLNGLAPVRHIISAHSWDGLPRFPRHLSQGWSHCPQSGPSRFAQEPPCCSNAPSVQPSLHWHMLASLACSLPCV